MSLLTSLWTGTSGLGAHGDAISVVGDNIANVSTIGFKGSRASFEDVLGGTAPNGQRIGAGVRMGGVQTLFGQGSLQQTGNGLDFAVRGNGFFVVAGNHDGLDGNWYTRDGRIHANEDGTLVNSQGLRLQGYTIDPTGTVGAAPGDITLPMQSQPVATTSLTLGVNLDSRATAPAGAWDPLNAAATSNFTTSATVYDSLGNAHRADVYFRANGSGGWDWHALVDGGELTGGTAGTPTEIATGTLTFDTDGALDSQTTTTSSADFLGATAGQAITFSFGDDIASGGTGLQGSTQFASPSAVNQIVQDGFGAGALVDLEVSDDGTITGRYSNGQTRPIAQLALARFASEDGLIRQGGQLFAESRDSGQALLGAAGTGGRGAVSAGALEGSNVDLGDELVTLIAYQRAFQANARTVSTADEMLAEVANLKR
jgi:flagellar hook protein FlgE